MTRIEWLLTGDPLFSLEVARRTNPTIRAVNVGIVESIPYVPGSGIQWDKTQMEGYVEPYPRIDPADYRYLGQRAVMP